MLLLNRYIQSDSSNAKPITAFDSLKDMSDRSIQSTLEQVCVKTAVQLIHHLENFYDTKDGPHSAWWYDLQSKWEVRLLLSGSVH